jgi:uncharacterized protein (DUF952 family)
VTIFHITERDAWTRALADGAYRAPSLDGEGFIHASAAGQVAATADRFYRGRAGLVLLCIDEARVAAPVRWEAPAPPPGAPAGDDEPTARFPHVYGPIPIAAVVRVVDLPPRGDGTFAVPDLDVPG